MNSRLCRIVLIVCLISLAGCRTDPTGPPPSVPIPPVVKAVYVLNEGNFGQMEARLTVYDVDRDTVYRDVFEVANGGRHLGSLGDDIEILNNSAYILMSGSENLEVIGLSDHSVTQSAYFPGDTPHDLLVDSVRSRIYITRLFKNSILIVNLSSLAVMDSVTVGSNPQGMVLHEGMLYVCNSGYGSDRTVTVIDLAPDTVRRTIVLSDGPAGGIVGPDGNIWIVCTGNAFGTPASTGKIFIIRPSDLAVVDSIAFTENLWGSIAVGRDGGVYVIGVSSGSFFGGPLHRIHGMTKFVEKDFVAGTFYSVAVDEATGDIYVTDAKDFAVDGDVRIYSKEGSLRKSFRAQKGPSGIAFKR